MFIILNYEFSKRGYFYLTRNGNNLNTYRLKNTFVLKERNLI